MMARTNVLCSEPGNYSGQEAYTCCCHCSPV
jgi:hypothetical protein